MSTDLPSERHDPYVALRHRDFRLYLAASMIATVGAEMQTVAIGWELYERTGSALNLGLVGLAQALPVLIFALPAGHLADRWPRTQIVIGTQIALAVASLGLALTSHFRASIPYVYGCLVLAGTATSFAFPARWALLPQLVPIEHFANAVTWRSSSWQISAVIGPALGGIGLAIWKRALPIYLIDAACGLAVCSMLAGVRVGPQRRAREPFSWQSLLAGIRFVRRTELILATITLDMFAVMLGGATALLPIYARDILHVGPTGLGCLRAAPPVGALVMAMAIAHRRPMRRSGRALLTAVTGFGITTIVFGMSRNYALSLCMLCLTGAFDNVSVVIRATLVQVLTPDAMRGRVSAVNSVFIGMSNELGGFESGLAAQLMGTVASVVAGGVGCLLVVAGVGWICPTVWRLGSLDSARRHATTAAGDLLDAQQPESIR